MASDHRNMNPLPALWRDLAPLLPSPPSDTERIELEPELRTWPSAYGELVFVPPPLLVDGNQLEYGWAPPRYGSATLGWE
ncbi:hypothetical protein [Arthrobacter sp. zg-Y769]|uniref:hypothetical protein n=1 Tax=Arthrobacter sp. zg-Y769 TaxID=2894191 RepID=UPI001E53D92D|nr:hypothetical protein [Arthrobacter sp. zg-Y769]MCC9204546.1 hypothetical protein [Arthrobacter sp. zg-Y769]